MTETDYKRLTSPVLFNLFSYDATLKILWRTHAPYLLKGKPRWKAMDMKIILQRDYSLEKGSVYFAAKGKMAAKGLVLGSNCS